MLKKKVFGSQKSKLTPPSVIGLKDTERRKLCNSHLAIAKML